MTHRPHLTFQQPATGENRNNVCVVCRVDSDHESMLLVKGWNNRHGAIHDSIPSFGFGLFHTLALECVGFILKHKSLSLPARETWCVVDHLIHTGIFKIIWLGIILVIYDGKYPVLICSCPIPGSFIVNTLPAPDIF